MNNKSLYIHIPFCNKLCFYCDFNKVFYNSKLADEYINDLVNSINNDNYQYYTIYIGGGSPSSLSNTQLEKLLKSLNKNIKLCKEFTIEVNPKDINEDKIKLFKEYGINRVSIGVQTFNDNLLKFINRDHSKQDILDCINLLRKYDINNISCDLMFGIWGQTKEDILNDLDLLTSLNVNHISTYALLIEPNTYFSVKNIQALDDDSQALYFDLIRSYLKNKGYIHYEVSNFSKPNNQSKHNLVYWHGNEYNCYGAGASGYMDSKRFTYTRSIRKYIDFKDISESSFLFKEDKEYEYIILHLRLYDGIDINEFNNLFNTSFIDKYSIQIKELTKLKLCSLENNRFFVNEENFFILNRILTYF